MGTFTSKYKVNDGSLFGRTETRVDVGKSIDGVAGIIAFLFIATVGLWFSGFLWLIFKTLKEPSKISYKEMQEYGIDTQPILDAKKKAWWYMFLTFPVAPLSGLFFYSSVKSALQPLLLITKEFNDSFIDAYHNAISEKKQIINNALSVHGRNSLEYKNIAQQELNDLMKMIKDEFNYAPSVMKILEAKSKNLLNIDSSIEFTSDMIGKEYGKIIKYDAVKKEGIILLNNEKKISFDINMWEDPEYLPEVGMENLNIYNDNGKIRIMTKSYQLESLESKIESKPLLNIDFSTDFISDIVGKELGKIIKYDSSKKEGIILLNNEKEVSFSINMWEDPEYLPEVGMENLNIYNDNEKIRIMTKSYQLEKIEEKIIEQEKEKTREQEKENLFNSTSFLEKYPNIKKLDSDDTFKIIKYINNLTKPCDIHTFCSDNNYEMSFVMGLLNDNSIAGYKKSGTWYISDLNQ